MTRQPDFRRAAARPGPGWERRCSRPACSPRVARQLHGATRARGGARRRRALPRCARGGRRQARLARSRRAARRRAARRCAPRTRRPRGSSPTSPRCSRRTCGSSTSRSTTSAAAPSRCRSSPRSRGVGPAARAARARAALPRGRARARGPCGRGAQRGAGAVDRSARDDAPAGRAPRCCVAAWSSPRRSRRPRAAQRDAAREDFASQREERERLRAACAAGAPLGLGARARAGDAPPRARCGSRCSRPPRARRSGRCGSAPRPDAAAQYAARGRLVRRRVAGGRARASPTVSRSPLGRAAGAAAARSGPGGSRLDARGHQLEVAARDGPARLVGRPPRARRREACCSLRWRWRPRRRAGAAPRGGAARGCGRPARRAARRARRQPPRVAVDPRDPQRLPLRRRAAPSRVRSEPVAARAASSPRRAPPDPGRGSSVSCGGPGRLLAAFAARTARSLLAGPGEAAGGVVVVEVGDDGVRVRRPDGSEASSCPSLSAPSAAVSRPRGVRCAIVRAPSRRGQHGPSGEVRQARPPRGDRFGSARARVPRRAARPAGLDRLVSVLRFSPAVSPDAEASKRLVDEARLAAQLHNPGLLRVLGIGRVDQSFYVSTELVEGRTLRAVLERCARESFPFAADHALMIASRAAAALEYLHGSKDEAGRRALARPPRAAAAWWWRSTARSS